MSKVLYFDCLSGISGDMTIGALLDLGVDKDHFLQELKKLNIDGYTLQIAIGEKMGITGTDFKVILDSQCTDHCHHDHHQSHDHGHHHHDHIHGHEHDHHKHHHEHDHDQVHHDHVHRNLYDIEKIISESDLSDKVKNLSRKMFKYVAEAEAKIHNKPVDEVHFHEVGAVDSIVDIVGSAICIDILGVEEIYSAPIHTGTGFVKCAHGRIPVPAPATLEILKDIPIYSIGIRSELVTPTGAAIIRSLAKDFIPRPEMRVKRIGYGLGDKDLEIANVLRVTLGEIDKKDTLTIIETNIDDMSSEVYSHLIPKLLESGALDVYLTNIIMKKNRPANKITVACTDDKTEIVENILFAETTTFGLRKYRVEKVKLDRQFHKINTRFGEVTLKAALKDGKIIKYSPEYEECKKIADSFNLPIRRVYDEIIYDSKDYFNKL